MEVQIASLCDAAADYGGKLSLLGAFDTIVAHQVPVVHPHCSIALRFIFRKEEEGQHTLLVKFGDEDGRPIVQPIETAFEVQMPNDLFLVTRNLVLNIQHMKFDRAGLYSVDIYVDGTVAASIPLQVQVLAPAVN